MTLPDALNLAMQHLNAGRLAEAEEVCRQIQSQAPGETNSLQVLGVIANRSGRSAEAADCFRQVIAQIPSVGSHHFNLGNALLAMGQLNEAAASYQRAIDLQPQFAFAHHWLGIALGRLKRYEEAVGCHRRALLLDPNLADAHYNLGAVLQELGRREEAIACHREALRLKPQHFDGWLALGYAYADLGKKPDAINCYQQALKINPEFVAAHNALGIIYLEQGRHELAAACFEKALELKPDYTLAVNNLGNVLRHQGRLAEASEMYRLSKDLNPDQSVAHSNYLISLHYLAGTTLADLAAAHAEFERRHGEPLKAEWPNFENDRDPDRRLRVGFASRDFVLHPVAIFLMCFLEHCDREHIETYCYNFHLTEDAMTARLKRATTHWRDAANLSDADVGRQITADRIDILFDLSGHTSGNRMPVFARKPAPIQITWAGYTGTTGLAAMDYILADRFEIPPEFEKHYRERVLRMPHDYICYEPAPYAPPPVELPALKNGFVTFGCFNNPTKISPEVVAAWSKILNRVPQSRLVLNYKGFDTPTVTKRLSDLVASHGVDPAQLELRGGSPHPEMLAEYQRIDLAIDSFPYNGGLTTCEALWMGVPVVTCPGEIFASRHSLSHLSNAGVTETIAKDLHDYVELAVSLATDLPRLAELRKGLRERVAASPLCDKKQFANDLTQLLRGVWREWCGKSVS